MDIQPLDHSDINLIADLIPKGWEAALPTIESYTTSDFCLPIKISVDKKIIGIGAAIINNDTAWLAHIIVHPDNRNQGIGKLITQYLVDSARTKGCDTVYLLATDLGEPVYKKIGFETETEYLIFKDINTNTFTTSENIVAFSNDFKDQIANLDRQVSGENRMFQFEQHLFSGFVYLQANKVRGFYLPTFREGLIICTMELAGQELMKLRLMTKQNAAFPIDNISAAEFMRQHNFSVTMTQKRMRLGRKRDWQPANIYNRVGGNLG